jgi:hypothetical protein
MISDSAAEKDAMERAVNGLSGTVTGVLGDRCEEVEITYMGQVMLPTQVCIVWGAPNGTVPQQIHEVRGVDQCIGPKSGWETQVV